MVEEHYERFEQVYPERFEDKYGYLRPVIRETVYKYINCGDLKQGFGFKRITLKTGSPTSTSRRSRGAT